MNRLVTRYTVWAYNDTILSRSSIVSLVAAGGRLECITGELD